jgi:hypothetical protein
MLAARLDRVVRAQAAEKANQQSPWSPGHHHRELQLETLAALEDFAAALEERGWPVPPPILLHLRVHRALCGPGRPQRNPGEERGDR